MGTIVSTSSAGTSTISPSGEISLVNGAGHIKLLPDGSVDINVLLFNLPEQQPLQLV